MEQLIQKPSLDLYPAERSRRSIEEVARRMRDRDLRLEPAVTTLRISFEYGDAETAQKVVREIVSRYAEPPPAPPAQTSKLDWRTSESKPAPIVEQIDPADLPVHPIATNRTLVIAAGFLAGLLGGVLIAVGRARPVIRSYLKFAVAAGAAGVVAGAGISFVIPHGYVSRAVVRMNPNGQTLDAAATGAVPRRRVRVVLNSESLTALIERRSLYTRELQNASLDRTVQTMRDRDLQVTVQHSRPLGGFVPVIEVAFEYPDRAQALDTVHAVVNQLIERDSEHTESIELLEAPYVEEKSNAAARLRIALAGLAAGLLLGVLWRLSHPHARVTSRFDEAPAH